MFVVFAPLFLASWAFCLNPEIQEKFEKLPRNDFIDYFNKKNFSWKLKNNDFITEEMMSTVQLSPSTLPFKPGNEISDEVLPENFDSLRKWNRCTTIILPLMPRENCSSYWAASTVAMATDKFCIHYGSYYVAPSDIDLTCCKSCFSKSYCSEGSPEEALKFWMREGIASYSCKSKMPANEACAHACDDEAAYYLASKSFASNVYRLVENDVEIRKEIFTNGPVLATFSLYEDFKDYKDGIYEHTHGKLIGHHILKVIGYGIEDGVPYWLALNSWGEKWGMNGLCRIKRSQPDLGFEKNVLSAEPRIIH